MRMHRRCREELEKRAFFTAHAIHDCENRLDRLEGSVKGFAEYIRGNRRVDPTDPHRPTPPPQSEQDMLRDLVTKAQRIIALVPSRSADPFMIAASQEWESEYESWKEFTR